MIDRSLKRGGQVQELYLSQEGHFITSKFCVGLWLQLSYCTVDTVSLHPENKRIRCFPFNIFYYFSKSLHPNKSPVDQSEVNFCIR